MATPYGVSLTIPLQDQVHLCVCDGERASCCVVYNHEWLWCVADPISTRASRCTCVCVSECECVRVRVYVSRLLCCLRAPLHLRTHVFSSSLSFALDHSFYALFYTFSSTLAHARSLSHTHSLCRTVSLSLSFDACLSLSFLLSLALALFRSLSHLLSLSCSLALSRSLPFAVSL